MSARCAAGANLRRIDGSDTTGSDERQKEGACGRTLLPRRRAEAERCRRPLPALRLSSSSDSLYGNVVVQRVAGDRVEQRRRAAALARHYRDQEKLAIAEIARRLGRAEATVKAYLYDPTGEKARAVKRRYQGVCRGCGAPTTARGGKGDAYQFCKNCHPGTIAPTRTRDWVREAMHEWRQRYGRPPSSTDWSRTHARRRGGEALERFPARDWPAPSTVTDIYGSWRAAHRDAFPDG